MHDDAMNDEHSSAVEVENFILRVGSEISLGMID